jgi:hypothetical protein
MKPNARRPPPQARHEAGVDIPADERVVVDDAAQEGQRGGMPSMMN